MTIGRNDSCRCGSGKKYKKCCLVEDEQAVLTTLEKSSSSNVNSLPNIMGSPDTPEGSLRQKIVSFAQSLDPKGKNFKLAREQWDGDRVKDYSGERGFARYISVMDYYIHDYLFPGKDQPALNLFYAEQGSSLPSAECSLLEGWLDNKMACYEVQALRRGEGVDLKDILTDRHYKVSDKSSSRNLVEWDLIYVRLIRIESGWGITGAAQCIRRHDKDRMIAYLKAGYLTYQIQHPSAALDEYLKRSSQAIRKFIWTLDEQYPLEMTTSTGESMTPIEVLFSLEDAQEVRRRLDAMSDFAFVGESDERPGGLRFDWIKQGPSADVDFSVGTSRKRKGTFQFITRLFSHDGKQDVPVLGNLDLLDRQLVVSCLSQERADALTALLEQRLGPLIRFSNSKRAPVETLRSRAHEKKSQEAQEIPAEIKDQIVREMLEDHYRRWKDMPLPVLNGHTPRQATKDPSLRPLLEELLKDIENIEARQKKEGMLVYGAQRLRAELGV